MPGTDPPRVVVGWDVGGAHVKGCLVVDGRVCDAAQWPAPLWQGLEHLDAALDLARQRWPEAARSGARHVATMTGEMVDLFPHREAGVVRLAAHLAEALGPSRGSTPGRPAGSSRTRGAAVAAIASANWRASAELLAQRLPDAMLVDVGSTTTDLIAVRGGAVAVQGDTDAARLATGELVYHGVVRTPLCALAARVPFRGSAVNVMNEFFATTADVYRLTGELDPAHDQQPRPTRSGKDAHATRQRLARMVGRDARDADDTDWLALAHAWRAAQLDEIGGQLERVMHAGAIAAARRSSRPAAAPSSCSWPRAARARVHRLHRRGAGRRGAPRRDLCAPALAVAALAASER